MRRLTPHLSLAVLALLATVAAPGIAHAACTSPAGIEGQMQWNFTTHVLNLCDGSTWLTAGSGSSSGTAGYIQFSGGSGAFSSDSTAGGQLYWDSTNHRLGIGTATPDHQLSVWSTDTTVYASSSASIISPTSGSSTTPALNVFNRSATNGAGAYLELGALESASKNNIAYIGAISNSGGFTPTIVIGQRTGTGSYAERMRIDSAGSVGIGKTASASYLVDINGALQATSLDVGANAALTRTGGSLRINTTAAAQGVEIYAGSSAASPALVVQNGTSNVGIGTTTPVAKLEVNGGIKIGNNAGTCTSTNNGEIRYTSGSSPPYNYCNGSAWVPFESGWVVPYTQFTAAKVMSALYHTCALKSTGALWCWGYNNYGEVSDGTTTTRLAPVAAGASFTGPWSSISVGTYNTCGIKSSGSSGWCWGYSNYGQIGDGTTTTRTTPTQISGTWIQLDTGGATSSITAADNGFYTCGVKSDNTGWCWGGNGSGALGDGTTTQRTSPVQVTGNWLGIWPARYGSHSCGIKTDNTLWCWGYNNYGQLGVGNTTDATTPQQVSGSWSSVVPGGAHTCGIKTDNTLWCWGYNGWGALGDGSTTNRTSPVQVSGGGSWSKVAIYSVGSSSTGITYGIKTNGTAWSWGFNGYGDTKTGSTSSYLSAPTALATSAVTSGSQWTDFEGGYFIMCGKRDDGTVYCWGSINYYNRLGDPNVTTYFNPVGG